ncbi:hypothetical protein CPB86DRAFT_162572 [Serendipita vermifera]|nr:hypothetical protein CPB86DRAFT_162572 [Serendipita vermifera]
MTVAIERAVNTPSLWLLRLGSVGWKSLTGRFEYMRSRGQVKSDSDCSHHRKHRLFTNLISGSVFSDHSFLCLSPFWPLGFCSGQVTSLSRFYYCPIIQSEGFNSRVNSWHSLPSFTSSFVAVELGDRNRFAVSSGLAAKPAASFRSQESFVHASVVHNRGGDAYRTVDVHWKSAFYASTSLS